MSKYAGEKTYAGQRASVGRGVIVVRGPDRVRLVDSDDGAAGSARSIEAATITAVYPAGVDGYREEVIEVTTIRGERLTPTFAALDVAGVEEWRGAVAWCWPPRV